MFENLEPIDPKKHKDLRFTPANDFRFAAKLASAPLSGSEVIEAARVFPVVFTSDGPLLPMALMSAKEGQNAFINDKGEWQGTYIPAHIRRYPFILGNTDTPGNFAIMLVADAPHFNGSGDVSEPLFTEDGERGTTLTKAAEFLSRFQSEVIATEALLAPLAETGVLTVQRLDLSDAEGKKMSFDGIRAVDREKLKEQDDATLADWVRNGLMAIIDAHLASLKHMAIIATRQGIAPK